MRCLGLLFCAVHVVQSQAPLPFPPCRATDTACLRRGLRTFFFLMEDRHLGMEPVDPSRVASLALAYPDVGLRFVMRNAEVTGARWTELVERRINIDDHINSVLFSDDFHVSSYLQVQLPVRPEIYHTHIVMDIGKVWTNISYPWQMWTKEDGEAYVIIGQEDVTVHRPRIISFFLESNDDEPILRNALENRPSILEHLATEITTIVMQNVVNNFRTFAYKIPFRFYYKVWSP